MGDLDDRLNPATPRYQYLLGRSYFGAKNYAEAARRYRAAADAGHADAMSTLGLCYVTEYGVVKDEQTAYDLFSKGSAAGSALAVHNLGAMYGNGAFVRKDVLKAPE